MNHDGVKEREAFKRQWPMISTIFNINKNILLYSLK